jgi:ribosomal-protein-alanine N-acetyltransferase
LELRSDRLRLRPARPADADVVHALWTDVEIRRFLFDDRCIPHEEALSFLQTSEATFATHGYGIWLAFLEDERAPVGFAGLLRSEEGNPHLIVGVEPRFWGQGLAAEASRAALRHAFENLGMSEVLADVDEPNVRSIALLERLGMALERRAMREGRPLRFYRVARAAPSGRPPG